MPSVGGGNTHSLRAKSVYLEVFDTDNLRCRHGCISDVGEARWGVSKLLCVPACRLATHCLVHLNERRWAVANPVVKYAGEHPAYGFTSCVCAFFVSQALPSWRALVHELFGTPIQIILILDMTDYSRFLQMEGLWKAVLLFACVHAFHEEECSALNKGIVFLLQNRTVLAVWIDCRPGLLS